MVEGRRLAQRMLTLVLHDDLNGAAREIVESGDAITIMTACQTAVQMAAAVLQMAYPLEHIRDGFVSGWFANLEGNR
jgi:hypothetical protein